MAMGQFFQCLELKIECSEQGIVRRENKTEEKSKPEVQQPLAAPPRYTEAPGSQLRAGSNI